MADFEPSLSAYPTSEYAFTCWEGFLDFVARLDDPMRKPYDEVWFRGQSDARWPLHTTLERHSRIRKVAGYLNLIGEIQPAVETFTGNQFSIPKQVELERACRQDQLLEFEQTLRECATYLAHLRHGGFPSPLLDWTLSPYVAAYFAFYGARHDGEVAIYAYREWPQGEKVRGRLGEPNIVSFGPIFKTHKRHFRQQSRYTSCVKFDCDEADGDRWIFVPHDEVFGQKYRSQQDFLWKIKIPASERIEVLRFCDKVNLNGFTLFDSEEGLLEMQAMREIDLKWR
jgi:hypothetical protein